MSFLRRAKAAGYTHLVITLDTTLLGWRPLDLDRGYSPFLENKGLANYTSDPVFQQRDAPAGRGRPDTGRRRVRGQVSEPRPELGPAAAHPRELGRPDPAQGDPEPARRQACRQAQRSTASSSRTTAAVRSTGRSRRSTRSRRSSRRSATRCPCSSTPGSARAATPSRRWPSAPTRCSSAGRTCTASRWTGRGAPGSSCGNFVNELERGIRKAGHRSHRTLSRSSLTRAR